MLKLAGNVRMKSQCNRGEKAKGVEKMRSTTFFLGALALVFVGAAPAGEVFMCKSYGGGTFWSSAHCSRHNALIERIVSVPDGMPFDQQVKLAEQDRAAAAGLVAQQTPSDVQQAVPTPSNQTACQALDAQIRQWDAMARQPHSPDAGLDHGSTPRGA